MPMKQGQYQEDVSLCSEDGHSCHRWKLGTYGSIPWAMMRGVGAGRGLVRLGM